MYVILGQTARLSSEVRWDFFILPNVGLLGAKMPPVP